MTNAEAPGGGAPLGVVVVLLVLGGLVWAAASTRTATAERPRLFAGSLLLEDTRALTGLDVATAQVTVRLEDIYAQVGAASDGDVAAVAVDGGTMIVNRLTGSFNFLGADDYVTDPNGPGVGLGPLEATTGAEAYPSGADAYIVRSGPVGSVSLVGRQTVAQAAAAVAAAPPGGHGLSAPAAVPPLGYSPLDGPVTLGPGSAAVSGPDLWVLVGDRTGCRVVQLHPSPYARQGLLATTRTGSAALCRRDAVEASGDVVGLATPGRVEMFRPGGARVVVQVPFTSDASRLVPVAGASDRLWYLAAGPGGWSLFGVGPASRPSGPYPLRGFTPSSDPVVPVITGGFLYTLDQNQTGRPTLWTIDSANGRMAPLPGTAGYPVVDPSERASFYGAQVLLDGPRVVFNNPQSLDAVVAFTDSDRPPAVVDKSQAVAISAIGPADLSHGAVTAPGGPGKEASRRAASAGAKSPVPVVEPVSQRVICARTSQKPYAPDITAITASSGTALIEWSYQLLDQTDCEPDEWTVQLLALTGSHQPARPVQEVYGQDRYLFTGLRPTTTYQATVTAYINEQSTPSTPATFTTAARGPDAPLSVRTVSDGHGNWVVSWIPCTEAVDPACVVPADAWTVTGAACNGSFVGTPPSVQVPGDEDRVTVSASDLRMLGAYLSFTVQGSLASGLVGDPTGDRACTEAYQRPDASAITVQGQGAEDPAASTVTATLSLETTGDPESVFGVPASEARFVYTVTSAAGTRTVGPTGQTSVVVKGLPAGTALTPSAEIYPAGHPEAAVTVTGADFSQTLSWPDLSATMATGVVDDADPNQGAVTVSFPPDLPPGPLTAIASTSADAPGSGPQMQCGGSGGAVVDYPPQPVETDRRLTLPVVDLVHTGGACTVSFSLVDDSTPDPYGGPSPGITADFVIGSQPSYSYSISFVSCGAYQCGPLGQPYTVEVDTTDRFRGGGDWAVSAADPDLPPAADPCYVTQAQPTPPAFPVDLQLPQSCPYPGRLSVTVGWTYLGQPGSYSGAPSNPPSPPATTTTTAPTSTTTSTSSTTSTSTTTTSTSTSTSSSTTSTSSSTTPGSPTTATGPHAAAEAGASGSTVLWSGTAPAAALLLARAAGRRRRSGRPTKSKKERR